MTYAQELMSDLAAADKAGDTELAQHIAGKIKQVEGQWFSGNVLRGAVSGLADVGRSVLKYSPAGPALKMIPGYDEYMERSKGLAKELDRESGAGGTIGRLGVDIAATGGIARPVAGALGWAGRQLGARALPRTAAAIQAPVTQAVVGGGAAGAYLTPDDPLKGAAYGGIGGGVGQQVLSRTLGRMARPVRLPQNDAAHINQEIQRQTPGRGLTVGQMVDPESFGGRAVRGIEETLTSLPLLGRSVARQRELGRQAWREAPLHGVADAAGIPRATRNAGTPTFKAMQEDVRRRIGTEYDTTLAGRQFRPTQVFQARIDDILDNQFPGMTAADRAAARGVVEEHILQRMQGGGQQLGPVLNQPIPLNELFAAQSNVRKIGNRARGSEMLNVQSQGRALRAVADEVYDAITRRFPRQGARLEELRVPNTDIGTLRVARRAGGTGGEFTPAQLSRVAEKKGNRGMEQWADMAEPFLTKDPAGWSQRIRAAILLGGHVGLGGVSAAVTAPALALFGTRLGQRALQGDIAAQRLLARAVDSGAVGRAGSVAGREVGLNVERKQ